VGKRGREYKARLKTGVAAGNVVCTGKPKPAAYMETGAGDRNPSLLKDSGHPVVFERMALM
jgi:hypothetical protein